MNQLHTFNHTMFGELPVIVIDNVEWFGATEAAKALSFSNPYTALQNHIDDDDLTDQEVIDRIGRTQKKKFVNESGLHSLIFGAAKQGNNPVIRENAKKFKRWVTAEVLPSIRKHGAYMTMETIERTLTDPDFIIRLATELKNEQQKRMQAEQQLQIAAPKAEMFDVVASSDKGQSMASVAKTFNWGRNRLFELLRDKKVLMKNNLPYQEFIDRGYFKVRMVPITRSSGIENKTQTLVTGKGVEYIGRLLKQNGFLQEAK